ncbi:hypothetical protein MKW98_005810, partial [Papaver atlanticum]
MLKHSFSHCSHRSRLKIHRTEIVLLIDYADYNVKADANFVSKAAPLLKNVSNYIFTDDKLQFHVSPLDAVFSTVKSVFSSMIKLVSSQFVVEDPLVVENDLILFKHNGVEIIGEVQQVVHHEDGLMETTLQCESGLEKFDISIYDIYNLTSLDEKEKEKMWRIYTSVECKDDDLEKMVLEIKDALDARDELKCNSNYNSVGVKSFYPQKTIVVISFVTRSKLKTPHFQHYMERGFKQQQKKKSYRESLQYTALLLTTKMPKSKRNRPVTLSKTKKKGREQKEKIVESIRKAVEDYNSIYVFSFENMRNLKFKRFREQLKSSS